MLPKFNCATTAVNFAPNYMNTPKYWYKPEKIIDIPLIDIVYLDPLTLQQITSVEGSSSQSATVSEKGIYWEYLNLYYNKKINELTDLLNQALVL